MLRAAALALALAEVNSRVGNNSYLPSTSLFFTELYIFQFISNVLIILRHME